MRLLLFFLVLNAPLFAQHELSGIVVDAADGKPLSFVHVFLKTDQQYGVITNERGEYRISLDSTQLNDQLVFSLMSYQTHFLRLRDLAADQMTYNLQMETAFLELAEIVVLSDLGLRAIVQKTMDNIPKIYGTKDYLLKAYSREYTINNGEYSQLIEAMLTIRDEPYNAPDREAKVWIDEFRLSDYLGNEDDLFQSRKAKQTALLNGYRSYTNAARYQQIHWVTSIPDSIVELTYQNRGEYLDGRDTLIRIGYEAVFKNSGIDGKILKELRQYFQGEVLINRSEYAMLRNTVGDIDRGHYSDVTYQKIGGKYFLQQLITDGSFRFDSLTNRKVYNKLLYVTDVITDPKAIKAYRKGTLLSTEALIEDIRTPYRPDFWEANPLLILLPAPEALEEGLSRIRSMEAQFRENARKVVKE